MDAYPDETTWSLFLYKSNIAIMSGDPYPLQQISNGQKSGRKKNSGRNKSSTRNLNNQTVDNDEIISNVCLSKSSTYHFIIKDLFGDGVSVDVVFVPCFIIIMF